MLTSSLEPLNKAIKYALIISSLGLGQIAILQTTQANTTINQKYQISAGALDSVLLQFASQSGVELSFDPKQIQHLKSQGLTGQYSIIDGFNTLLTTHNLTIQQTMTGYKLTERSKSTVRDMGQLNTIDVAAQRLTTDTSTMQLPIITVTAEDKNSYITKSSNSATKLNLSLRETPQSVSVITQQRIQDQQLTTLTDVLNQSIGISSQRYGTEGSNVGGSEFYARASAIENFQIDGVPTSSSDVISSTTDTLAYENISILRGSAGLLNGAGYPSASINLQRKHAKDEPYAMASISASRWNTYRTQIDASNALNIDKTVRGYFAAAFEQGDSFRNYATNQHTALYGIIDTDISDHSVLSIGIDAFDGEYKGGAQRSAGIVFDNINEAFNVPRSFNSSARWNNSQETRYNLFSTYTTNFSNDWKTIANINYINRDAKHVFGVVGNWELYNIDGQPIGNYFAGAHDFKIQQLSFDLSAQGPYQLFGREHELMLGVGVNRYKNNGPEYDWYYNDPVFDETTREYLGGGIDISTWDGNTIKPDTWNVAGHSSDDIRQSAVYLATRLKPTDALSVILGSRISNYKQVYSYTWGTGIVSEENVWTPYAGFVFDINHNFSAYTSYTSIFKPQEEKDRYGKTLKPLKGNTYELGIKAAFYDD